MAGGYYVFEADDLDEALELAAQIPAATYGAVEIWPMAGAVAPTVLDATNWFALLLEPPTAHQQIACAGGVDQEVSARR